MYNFWTITEDPYLYNLNNILHRLVFVPIIAHTIIYIGSPGTVDDDYDKQNDVLSHHGMSL